MDSKYPRIFDTSKLTDQQRAILASFFRRRKLFDSYILEKNLPIFTCPSCGFPTIVDRGDYEICDVCNWEDDNQDDDRADEVWGGPNSDLSLTESRLDFGLELASKMKKDPNYLVSLLNNDFLPLRNDLEK